MDKIIPSEYRFTERDMLDDQRLCETENAAEYANDVSIDMGWYDAYGYHFAVAHIYKPDAAKVIAAIIRTHGVGTLAEAIDELED